MTERTVKLALAHHSPTGTVAVLHGPGRIPCGVRPATFHDAHLGEVGDAALDPVVERALDITRRTNAN